MIFLTIIMLYINMYNLKISKFLLDIDIKELLIIYRYFNSFIFKSVYQKHRILNTILFLLNVLLIAAHMCAKVAWSFAF